METRPILAILLFLIIFSLVGTNTFAANINWNIQMVDQTGLDCSLVLDSSNNPCITYLGDSNGHTSLIYSSLNGSNWIKQVVNSIGSHPYLVIDSSEKPHILSWVTVGDIYHSNTKQLTYTSLTSFGWKTQIVDQLESANWDFSYSHDSAVLDQNDNPHVCYFDNLNFVLKYGYFNSTWVVKTVDSAADGGSIAVDSTGYSHISFCSYPDNTLKYAKWTGSNWNIQTIDSNGKVGFGSSIALDSKGNPHISYFDETNGALKYAVWSGSEWIISLIEKTGFDQPTSLALDKNDSPQITYSFSTYNDTDRILKYAKWTGTSWSIELLEKHGGIYRNSLALDSLGQPHITYGTVGLKYAYIVPTLTAHEERNQIIINCITVISIGTAACAIVYLLHKKKKRV
jgi:hypothetical protein